jgi:hypothetical protein
MRVPLADAAPARRLARLLRSRFPVPDRPPVHRCQAAVARLLGYRHWHELCASCGGRDASAVGDLAELLRRLADAPPGPDRLAAAAEAADRDPAAFRRAWAAACTPAAADVDADDADHERRHVQPVVPVEVPHDVGDLSAFLSDAAEGLLADLEPEPGRTWHTVVLGSHVHLEAMTEAERRAWIVVEAVFPDARDPQDVRVRVLLALGAAGDAEAAEAFLADLPADVRREAVAEASARGPGAAAVLRMLRPPRSRGHDRRAPED